jgi:transcriptional regulator with XRE-family HTH domain
MRGEKRQNENSHCARAKLGHTLRSWRKARGTPMKAIAADLEVSIETVSAWERGDQFPTPENLDKLSRYIGVPVCRFFCQRLGSCPPECLANQIQV